MHTTYTKAITSIADLKSAMRTSLERSIHYHPPPSSLLLPEDIMKLRSLNNAKESEVMGYAIMANEVEVFLLGLGVSRKTSSVFYDLSIAVFKGSIPEIIDRVPVRDGFDLSANGIKVRARSFVILLGAGKFEGVVRQLVETYLDEFEHLIQRWDFLPSDDDHSPESIRRKMQAFKIAVFERKDHEVDPPLRRSKRLSCKVAVSSGETALEMASRTRLSISGPVTPPKRNRKVAFEDAEEKPREVQMAKKRKIEKPKLKENRTSNAKAYIT